MKPQTVGASVANIDSNPVEFFRSFVHNIYNYLYIYIYTRLQKHCYYRNIYHIYVYDIYMPKKDLSKVDTHYTRPMVWPLLAIFFL